MKWNVAKQYILYDIDHMTGKSDMWLTFVRYDKMCSEFLVGECKL